MFASDATRSSVANRVTYSEHSRFATSKPSEQKTAATSAVRHTIRRLGRNLKTMKNSATPSANEIISRLKRHNQSLAKLRLTLPALRASQVATRAPSTSSAPVPSTMARSSSFATGHERRSSVSNTSLSAARRPPNRSAGQCRSPTDASRARPSRDGLVLLFLRRRTLAPAATALRLGQPSLDRDAGGGRLFFLVLRGVEQLAQLARLLGREVA